MPKRFVRRLLQLRAPLPTMTRRLAVERRRRRRRRSREEATGCEEQERGAVERSRREE